MKYYFLELINIYLVIDNSVVDCAYAYIRSDNFDSSIYAFDKILFDKTNYKQLYYLILTKLIKDNSALKNISCVYSPFNVNINFVELT